MKIFTTSGAAKRLNVNRSRVIQLITEGKLKATKFGWSWMIVKEDLTRLQKERKGKD